MDISYKQKFYETYIKEIFPKFADIECKRQELFDKLQTMKILGIILITIVISVLCVATVIYYYDIIYNKNFRFTSGYYSIMWCFIFISMISFLPYAINKYSYESNFKSILKKNFMHIFVKAIPDLKYLGGQKSIKDYKSLDFYSRSKLFGYFDWVEADDVFEGKYLDTPFQIQELKFVKYGDKNNSYITVFNGILILLPSNKSIKGQTIIQPKLEIRKNYIKNFIKCIGYFLFFPVLMFISALISQENSTDILKSMYFLLCFEGIVFALILIGHILHIVNSLLIKIFNKIFIKSELNKVIFEDVNFINRFNVYSQDEIEARYLVTTAFMDRLMNIQTAFGTKNIKCSFFEDNILFAIETKKDLFEIGNLYVSLKDSRQVNNFFEEIISIYKMIDYFKLVQKTGL